VSVNFADSGDRVARSGDTTRLNSSREAAARESPARQCRVRE